MIALQERRLWARKGRLSGYLGARFRGCGSFWQRSELSGGVLDLWWRLELRCAQGWRRCLAASGLPWDYYMRLLQLIITTDYYISEVFPSRARARL